MQRVHHSRKQFISWLSQTLHMPAHLAVATVLGAVGTLVCTGTLLFAPPASTTGHGAHLGMIKASAASYVQASTELPRAGWSAVSSDQYYENPAGHAIDGKTETMWHSQFGGTAGTLPLPHSITIDMKRTQQVMGLTYLPRQDRSMNGTVGRYSVHVSADGSRWGSPVTSGVWSDDRVKKEAIFKPIEARYIRLTAYTEAGNRGQWSSAAEINVLAGVRVPPPLPRTGWSAVASDQYYENPAHHILDGNAATMWHSQFGGTAGTLPLPHSITIDMKSEKNIAGLSYLPRQDLSKNGTIGAYSISVSTDGRSWGSPVASGTWADTPTEKTAAFSRVNARYVRLTATSEAGNRGQWSSAAEINVRGSTPDAAVGGKWDNPIGFPLVPTSAVLLPNNKLLTFAAYSDTMFNKSTALTRVAILDLTTGQVSNPSTVDTDHQMFCTGLALLADGRVLIDGGSSDRATTLYNPTTDTWSKGPQLNIARGYQGDTLLSNGKVLTLGGSWIGGYGGKDGEIFTPTASGGSWSKLSGVSAANIVTQDRDGVYRADNHAWLFGVDNGWAFHAGPSKQMHWIDTAGNGSMTSAGLRSDSDHAMNGNAVMYDIGKILTVGGASSYENSQASNHAYTIDISRGPAQPVITKRVGDLTYPRSFGNSVALPDGKVLTLGGQQYPKAFTDTGAVFSPELWDPATGQFTVMAPETVQRTYHSVAILLADGRVFSGGGGLCGNCSVNHLSGQIFTPPYLLNPDGSLRNRPVIARAPTAAAAGDTITVTTAGTTASSFSLVRMSAVTHSVNNDQRRVPLKISNSQGNTHTLILPDSSGVLLPGNYLLFALDAAGTPSVAKTILIR